MSRRLAIVVCLAFGVAVAAGGAVLLVRPLPPEPDVDPLYDVGDFTLTERSGRTVSRADLLGKVWVASFVFTRCTGPCPQVTGTMARLQSELADQPDVRLVTFTVDPERDEPATLSRYAEQFGADPQRWLFLTGQEAEVHRFIQESFRVPVEKRTGADVRPGTEIGHSPRLAVVDRRGRVRGYYDGIRETLAADPEKAFADNLRRLRHKVAALLREQP
jgi:cytochrome oxidase Cu insertion factor (SCO1/SenC/PrrC family)